MDIVLEITIYATNAISDTQVGHVKQVTSLLLEYVFRSIDCEKALTSCGFSRM